jgi:hypothetical protein
LFIPFLLVEYPPLVDYPVHLSRQFILQNLESIPQLQENYQLAWGIKPNLAMDLIVPILSIFLPINLATKIFVMLSIALIIIGTLMLSKQIHGRVGLLPFGSLLFVYNMALWGGLVNYLFSMGLVLVSLALWLKLKGHSFGLQTIALSALCVTLFFSHLFGLALLGLCILCYELSQAFIQKKFSSRPFLIFILALFPSAIFWLLKPAGPPLSEWIWKDKFSHVASLLSGAYFFEKSDVVFIFILCALFLLFFIFAFKKNQYIESKPFIPLVFTLILISPFIPDAMMGGYSVMIRIPVLIPFMILAILPPEIISHRLGKYFLVSTLLLLSLRSFNITDDWLSKNRDFSEYLEAAKIILPGSRVIQAWRNDNEKTAIELSYQHITELSIPNQYFFIPHMAKIPDQQPIAPSKQTAFIDGGTAAPISLSQLYDGIDLATSSRLLKTKMDGWQKPYWAFWPQNFDYLVFLHMREPQENPSPNHLKLIKAGSYFDIYKIQGSQEGRIP